MCIYYLKNPKPNIRPDSYRDPKLSPLLFKRYNKLRTFIYITLNGYAAA